MYTDEHLVNTVDNVKEVIEREGIHVVTEDGEFWVHCGTPSLTSKLADDVASVDVDFDYKSHEERNMYFGIVKNNGEVWVSSEKTGTFGTLSGKQSELKKIFPVD